MRGKGGGGRRGGGLSSGMWGCRKVAGGVTCQERPVRRCPPSFQLNGTQSRGEDIRLNRYSQTSVKCVRMFLNNPTSSRSAARSHLFPLTRLIGGGGSCLREGCFLGGCCFGGDLGRGGGFAQSHAKRGRLGINWVRCSRHVQVPVPSIC